jgi:hypothetical protein
MSPQGYQAINPVLIVLGPAEFANGDRAKGFSINTTVSHTLRANSLWGASNASQTVFCARGWPTRR